MKINHKTSVMLFISALFLVFSVLVVSPFAPHSDSITAPMESVKHSQLLTIDRLEIVQQNYEQVKFFTANKQIGSPDPFVKSIANNDLTKLLPFYINLANEAFCPTMLESYQYIVRTYLSHQQFLWHAIKRQGFIKPFIQYYERLDYFLIQFLLK